LIRIGHRAELHRSIRATCYTVAIVTTRTPLKRTERAWRGVFGAWLSWCLLLLFSVACSSDEPASESDDNGDSGGWDANERGGTGGSSANESGRHGAASGSSGKYTSGAGAAAGDPNGIGGADGTQSDGEAGTRDARGGEGHGATGAGSSGGDDGNAGAEASECPDGSVLGLPDLRLKLPGTGQFELATADFNGDGYADLAFPGSHATVAFGRGNGHFSTLWSHASAGTYPLPTESAVASGDLNGDGAPDLVMWNEASVRVLLNDGVGWFETSWILYEWLLALVLADVNHDGYLDIVGAAPDVVALNRGDGTFDEPIAYSAHPGSLLVAANLVGDDAVDLVIARTDGSQIGVLPGRGDGTFEPAISYATGIEPPQVSAVTRLVSADFDGNGWSDIALTTEYDDSVRLLMNDGGGRLISSTLATTGSPRALVTVDLDGRDGVDLAVVSARTQHLNVFLNRGDGDFTSPVVSDAGPHPTAILAADFNGDDRPDLAIGSGTNIPFDDTESGVYLALNRGDGSFPVPHAYATGKTPYALGVADFDANGIADLAVANRDSNDVSILLNDGAALGRPLQYGMGKRPVSLATADFDRDGTVDVVAANSGEDSVTLRFNNGHGAFGAAVSYQVGVSPSAVVAADFNADDASDVAVTSVEDARVNVLINRGDGSFHAAVGYATELEPVALVAVELSGDGAVDFAVANHGSSSVSVFRNRGDGTFEPQDVHPLAPVLSSKPAPTAIVAIDLLNDGWMDLITANAESATLSVKFNEGEGQFSAGTEYYATKGVNSLTTGDFDVDAKDDLWMASNSGLVAVMTDRGDGSLDETVLHSFVAGKQARAIVSADWNNDGKLDVAVANPAPEDGYVRILPRTCIAGPTRPAAAAGLRLDVAPSARCFIPDTKRAQAVGNPPPNHFQTTGQSRGGPIADGGDSRMQVVCAVVPSTGYRVRASIRSMYVAFDIDALALDAEGRGQADIKFFSSAVEGWLVSSTPCEVRAISMPNRIGIEPGALWATFSCTDMFGGPIVSPQTCSVEGEIVLEHCVGQ